MQEQFKKDVNQVEDDGLKVLKDDKMVENMNMKRPNYREQPDPATALQTFLDRIPISFIPAIRNSPVVELKTGDSVKDAIRLMYEKNVSGAAIAADVVDPDATIGRFLDQYMGFVEFSSLVLWSVQKCENDDNNYIKAEENDGGESGKGNFFTVLERSPEISQTKVGELAKCFLWEPFFPVNLDDTLFHVLLLFSKHHRLQAVPVVDQSDSHVTGFVTQNAVIKLLLQSIGLGWFDGIADKALSEYHFESDERVAVVCGDQSLAEGLGMLWESRLGAVAVVSRETGKIIGCLRNSDVHLLLENDQLFNDSKSLSMREFVHMGAAKEDADPTIDKDMGALLSAGALRLSNSFLPRMCSPVTAKRSETLTQAMNRLAERKGSFCFLVDDETQQLTGMITLRDVIIQFAPPCVDSCIGGGGFFESALEQTGCWVKNGTIVCDH